MKAFKWTSLSWSGRQADLPGRTSTGPEHRAAPLAPGFERQADPQKASRRADLTRTEFDRRTDIAALARQKRQSDAQTQTGRQSQMVREDHPRPMLKPSPALAHGPDRAAFNQRWKQEERAALIAEARVQQQELRDLSKQWSGTMKDIAASTDRARAGDPNGATREAFKAYRRTEAQHHPTMARSQQTLDRGEAVVARDTATPSTPRTPPRGDTR